jgi:hypothetical protein
MEGVSRREERLQLKRPDSMSLSHPFRRVHSKSTLLPTSSAKANTIHTLQTWQARLRRREGNSSLAVHTTISKKPSESIFRARCTFDDAATNTLPRTTQPTPERTLGDTNRDGQRDHTIWSGRTRCSCRMWLKDGTEDEDILAHKRIDAPL